MLTTQFWGVRYLIFDLHPHIPHDEWETLLLSTTRTIIWRYFTLHADFVRWPNLWDYRGSTQCPGVGPIIPRKLIYDVGCFTVLATKPSFWLNTRFEVLDSLGFAAMAVQNSTLFFTIRESWSRLLCCAGVDGKGTSLGPVWAEFRLWQDLVNQGDLVHLGMLRWKLGQGVLYKHLNILINLFSHWDNRERELSRPGPILERKTLNLNWQEATPCIFSSIAAGNPASQWTCFSWPKSGRNDSSDRLMFFYGVKTSML